MTLIIVKVLVLVVVDPLLDVVVDPLLDVVDDPPLVVVDDPIPVALSELKMFTSNNDDDGDDNLVLEILPDELEEINAAVAKSNSFNLLIAQLQDFYLVPFDPYVGNLVGKFIVRWFPRVDGEDRFYLAYIHRKGTRSDCPTHEKAAFTSCVHESGFNFWLLKYEDGDCQLLDDEECRKSVITKRGEKYFYPNILRIIRATKGECLVSMVGDLSLNKYAALPFEV